MEDVGGNNLSLVTVDSEEEEGQYSEALSVDLLLISR